MVQPGDVVCTDIGIVYAGLATDYQKTAYVLRPGEKEPPQGLQQAFANAVKVQEAVVEVAKPGAIGYQVKEAAEALARSRGLQPSVYSHSVAVGGHDIGAFISADWPDRWGVRATFPLRAGACYSIESSATTALPEWGGRPITLATEEDTFLSDAGLRYVVPRQEKLYVIGGAAAASCCQNPGGEFRYNAWLRARNTEFPPTAEGAAIRCVPSMDSGFSFLDWPSSLLDARRPQRP